MSPHVLVARQDSVGDVLLAGPAVRAVAAGAGRVTLLCGPRGRAAAELLPGVDQVVVEHAAWIDAQPERITRKAMDSLVDRLTDLEVDQAAILTSFHQSPLPLALLLRMAGVPIIAAVSVDYPGSLLDVRHRVDDDLHEVVRGLSLVATLGYRLPEGDEEGSGSGGTGPPACPTSGAAATWSCTRGPRCRPGRGRRSGMRRWSTRWPAPAGEWSSPEGPASGR